MGGGSHRGGAGVIPRECTHLDAAADPARLAWHEVSKVSRYYLAVDAMTKPTTLQDERGEYKA